MEENNVEDEEMKGEENNASRRRSREAIMEGKKRKMR
jgi:hypothetical protein